MSDEKSDGGPAFPVPTDMSGGESFYLATPGMSLRDWFAGQADVSAAMRLLHKEGCEIMIGRTMPSADEAGGLEDLLRWHFAVIAKLRGFAADAMLAERAALQAAASEVRDE